jgi:creatinine amidohydrolase
MTHGAESWRSAYRVLDDRVAALPDALRTALELPLPPLACDPARVRRVVATGAGSSAAHARLLVALLEECGVAARFVPLSAFVAPPRGDAREDALVVFSQGLSPNARLALRDVERWASVTLVTAVPESAGTPLAAHAADPPSGPLAERRSEIARLEARGVVVAPIPAAEEYGTLLRVTGPLVGSAVAIRLAQGCCAVLGRAPAGLLPRSVDVDAACERVAAASERMACEHADLDAAALEQGLVLLTSGTYGEIAGNLRAKVLEGMLLPAPPLWDLLEFAHGPFQQLHPHAATLLALARDDASGEADLLARLESMLVPGRHRLVRLRASLPGALALLEHESLLDALVLRYVAERRIDQGSWPGRGADRALYDVGRRGRTDALVAAADVPAPPPRAVRLEHLAWPDVEALLASGCRTALLPLGSTEQHGPHLPLATDTLIAEAVAERVCARLVDVVRLPALALGCAREHASFAGTLWLEEATLEAVLRDLARSLAAHGFERLLVFTAHGGNYGVLRAAAERLAPEVEPLRLEPFLDSMRLAKAIAAAGARFGVNADEAGQHAGETETSLVAALAPALLRRERLARGLVGALPAPDELFYPDLRRHAPDGTVGDPRAASAARAGAYLDAWAGVLLDAWSAERKKRK